MDVHGGMGAMGGDGARSFLFGLYKGLHHGGVCNAGRFPDAALVGYPRRGGAVDRNRAHPRLFRVCMAGSGQRRNRHAVADAARTHHRRLRIVVCICDAQLRTGAAVGPQTSARVAVAGGLGSADRAPRASRLQLAGPRRALVVQSDIDTELQWTEDNVRDTEQKLASLSRAPGANLVIWPEVPAPFYVSDAQFPRLYRPNRADGATTFLFGAVGFTPQREPLNSCRDVESVRQDRRPLRQDQPGSVRRIYSAAVRMGEQDHQRNRRFRPRRTMVVFPLDGHKLGAFICYESDFLTWSGSLRPRRGPKCW